MQFSAATKKYPEVEKNIPTLESGIRAMYIHLLLSSLQKGNNPLLHEISLATDDINDSGLYVCGSKSKQHHEKLWRLKLYSFVPHSCYCMEV